MKSIPSAVFLVLTALVCRADQPSSPGPNAELSFRFPELGNTLLGMVSGNPRVPELSAILPSNYSREGKHPLFVYIKGGSGGPEDGGAMARGIAGDKDYIAVSVPLFKKEQPPGRTRAVAPEDFPVVSGAYRAMFGKLAAAVPNIDWERSVIGGHSNGAHTLGVLLSGKDDFISSHFRTFWFHEGGFAYLTPGTFGAEHLKKTRVLALVADHSGDPRPDLGRIVADQLAGASRAAEKAGIEFKLVVMHGYGHDVPPEYMRNVRQFARGEPVEDIVSTEKALAAKSAAPLKSHPDSSSWNDLLVGDLTNMKVPGGAWRYKDGVLSSGRDQPILSKAVHGDCVLDFEFKLEPGAESGVYIRTFDERNLASSSVEIQLRDDHAESARNAPPAERCGAFFGRRAPDRSAVKPAGEWNRMTIAARGGLVAVVLNGEAVNEIDLSRWKSGDRNPDGAELPAALKGKPPAEWPTRGQIGLQGGRPDAGVAFRNLKLLRLH